VEFERGRRAEESSLASRNEHAYRRLLAEKETPPRKMLTRKFSLPVMSGDEAAENAAEERGYLRERSVSLDGEPGAPVASTSAGGAAVAAVAAAATVPTLKPSLAVGILEI
jgi:hypothetical protein